MSCFSLFRELRTQNSALENIIGESSVLEEAGRRRHQDLISEPGSKAESEIGTQLGVVSRFPGPRRSLRIEKPISPFFAYNPVTMIVTDTRQLQDLCSKLRGAGSFGFDTEFVRERTYYIRLGILQVATAEIEAILDPHEIDSLAPFLELISDPSVEKVVHAGEQDFAVLFERSGKAPANVFDTQIASALVGFGEQLSYAKIVEKVAHVKLPKLETLTDWTSRPLTKAQVDYALEDVRYLPCLREHLGRRLRELERETWTKEECRYLEEAKTYTPAEPSEVYERIKSGGMDGSQLGVLREIAAWREEQAMKRNLPRGWVLRDQTLVEIARRQPGSFKELKHVRNLRPKDLDRYKDVILKVVQKGLENPLKVEITKDKSARIRSRVKALVRMMDAWLHTRAAAAKVSPTMVATKDQLKELAEAHIQGQNADVSVLGGWRRALVGQELLEILAGRLQIRVHSETGKLVADRVSESED
jgi:ribonuclease D